MLRDAAAGEWLAANCKAYREKWHEELKEEGKEALALKVVVEQAGRRADRWIGLAGLIGLILASAPGDRAGGLSIAALLTPTRAPWCVHQ